MGIHAKGRKREMIPCPLPRRNSLAILFDKVLFKYTRNFLLVVYDFVRHILCAILT
jgi:hypothetical protein